MREEEDELFPKLRAKLGEPEAALLLGEIQREKAMVLQAPGRLLCDKRGRSRRGTDPFVVR